VCEVARLKGSTVGGAFIPFTRRRYICSSLHGSDPHSHHTTCSRKIVDYTAYHHAQDHRKRQFPFRHPIAEAGNANPQQPPYPYPCPSRCPIKEELTQYLRFTPSLSLPLHTRKRLCICRRSIDPSPKSRSTPWAESLARFFSYGCSWLSAAQHAKI